MRTITSGLTRNAFALLAGAAVCAPLLAQAALADSALPIPTPLLAPDAARARTQTLLDTHCAACHRDEWQALTGAATSGIPLDDLALEPALVVPGQPDASRLYHVLLQRHRPQIALPAASGNGNRPGGSGAAPAPEPGEIEAVRDWIAGLSPPTAPCAGSRSLTASGMAALADAWRKEDAGAAGLRFASIAPLANACHSERALMNYRDELGRALANLAPRPIVPRIETIGDDNALLAVRLHEVSLSPEAWDAIVAGAPRMAGGVVPADWLALKAAGTTSPLARRYSADVDLARAAAELGMGPSQLEQRIAALEGPIAKPARQLRQGVLPRELWEELYTVLAGEAPRAIAATPASGPMRLGLWSDKTAYVQGELTTLTAMATQDCYLTLISVDSAGIALVLFPNDFEQENFLRGGTSITLPMRSATYQLRAKTPGRESVVGICSTGRAPPHGIVHDFEPHRFTVLGDWRSFLRLSMQREVKPRRQRKAGPPPPPGPPPVEARAAVVFEVE